jgi:hypothetical protein
MDAVVLLALLLTSFVPAAQSQPQPVDPTDLEFFETSIRPLLAARCYSCHGPGQQFASLRLDSRQGLLKGGKSGPAVVPGDSQQSLLMQAVRGDIKRMPLGGELDEKEVSTLADWISRGAPWPAAVEQTQSVTDRYAQQVSEHWAFQPVGTPEPPEVSDPAWAANPIDRFVRDRLQTRGLAPSAPAGRDVLIRRLSYLLTGLPPSADDVRNFVSDSTPNAYERLVDRLLASARFGEHWARHWLDLVRFAETRGYEWNYEIIGAWRYRDYLVRAFNQDVAYDQFVREHIAGDLLEEPRINETDHINESVIGTAFYRLGEAGHDDCVMFREIALDVVDSQIDVLSKTFQGLTVGCARCHDHKLDPIPTVDYYGLYSILNSSRVTTHTVDTPAAREEALLGLRDLKEKIRAELAAIWSRQATGLGAIFKERAALNRWFPEEEAEPSIEDPAYPLYAIARAHFEGVSFSSAFADVEKTLRSEQESRSTFNRKNFESFADFRQGDPDGWTTSGLGLRDGPSLPGDFAIASSGETAIRGIFQAGRYTHTISTRLNGAIRSPLLSKGPRKLSLLAVGGMLGARRTVIDNCAIGEDYTFVDSAQPEWITIDLKESWGELPAFVELVTRWDNPRIPDRPDKIKEPHLKLLDSPESYFGVIEAVLHDGEETPRAGLSHLLPLFEGPPADSEAQLAARYQQVVTEVIERWANASSTDDDARWLAWLLDKGLLSNQPDASKELARLIGRYRRIEAALPQPRVVEGLEDVGGGRDFPVLISGSPGNAGEPAPRRFLSRLFGDEPLTQAGSGRRELAELVADKDNPLTARVMVNRVWHHLFSRGIVATTDNFGALGERPSHPELLDFLAGRFVDDGWSVKSLIRLIVTSKTFRQSAETDEAAMELDPLNALLHHFPVRRLAAEEIRDSLLTVSGELQSRMYGESVDPYRERPKDYRRLFSGPLMGDGRRSLYVKTTRMEGYGFLETFDLPMPASTRGVRDTTTVPAQSLTLLNDPLVISAAEHCAARVLARVGTSNEQRIAGIFEAVLSRSPSQEETTRFAGLIDRLATLRDSSAGDVSDESVLWRDVAHVLLNTKEFLYVE